MPKMKSNSGAKKRFRVTGSGKFRRSSMGRRHLLTHKSRNRKRRLRLPEIVHETQQKQVQAMLPYER